VGKRTVLLAISALLISLATLSVLIEALLTTVLGVITLLIVLLVLGRVTAISLARLEALRGGLESGGGGVRSEGATLALALLVDV
jgi:hypothetical protein